MIFFLGVRTDRRTRFWNPHMETCWHTKNFNSKLKIRSQLSVAIYGLIFKLRIINTVNTHKNLEPAIAKPKFFLAKRM